MTRIDVDHNWCKGCHICVEICPRDVLQVDETRFVRAFHPVVVSRPEDCTGCLLCELLCPDLAITVECQAQRSRS